MRQPSKPLFKTYEIVAIVAFVWPRSASAA
jgi:hypothetical protein